MFNDQGAPDTDYNTSESWLIIYAIFSLERVPGVGVGKANGASRLQYRKLLMKVERRFWLIQSSQFAA